MLKLGLLVNSSYEPLNKLGLFVKSSYEPPKASAIN